MSAQAGPMAGVMPALDRGPEAFRERRWAWAALAAGDLAAVEICLLLGYLARQAVMHWRPAEVGVEQITGMALGLALLPLALAAGGLYPGYGLNPVQRLRMRMRTTLMVVAGLVVWDYLVQHGGWSRGVLLGTAVFAMVLPLAMETALIGWLAGRGWWGAPVLVLGPMRAAAPAIDKLRRQARLGLVPALHLDTGALGGWLAANQTRGIRLAVVTTPTFDDARLGPLLETLPFSRVIVVPENWGLQSHWVATHDLGGLMGLEMQRNLLRAGSRRLKRAMDIGLSVPLLVVCAPVIGALALWVKRVSPGPAFYAQEREGFGGVGIRVWKLRTMHPGAESQLAEVLAGARGAAEEWSASFKLREDPRVLPGAGRLMRRYSLDELPQLWNVLKGEMSIVGPRPFPYYHLEQFSGEFVRLRRQVRPGITGLWQVTVRGDGDLESQQTLDTHYIRNWSLWLDAHILARTLRAVIKGKGAY